MKLNKTYFFDLKSYVCNIRDCKKLFRSSVLLLIILAILCAGCGCSSTPTDKVEGTDEEGARTNIEQQTLNLAKERSIEIATLYKELYANAEKSNSDYYYNQTVIPQSVVDEIENLLIDKGYPVMNSDSKYPSFLENSESLYEFWDKVSKNEDSEQELISIALTGELYYTALHHIDGKKYRDFVGVGWSEDNKPTITTETHTEIMDWELITETDFYYQIIYPPRVPFEDYAFVRLKPMDKTLYDLTEKYISPIGYLSNNMFVSEWNYNDYGHLSFNDLLEFFYRVRNDDFFYEDNFETVREPYFHTYIPAELFEETVLPYFDISLQEFRKRSLYDSEKNVYPWQEICCDNVTDYPSVEPEVVSCKENDDNTITLTVNVRCNDYKTDKLFTHEVVIRELDNGQYQYLSNKITYKSDIELPPDRPRLPEQREENTK